MVGKHEKIISTITKFLFIMRQIYMYILVHKIILDT